MSALALLGGTPEIKGSLTLFNTIGAEERILVQRALARYPLSGFLGGVEKTGYYVAELERRWSSVFKIKHSIACNSATSGLLAACAAAGISSGDEVITTPYTMSATSAAPRLLGANIKFADIEDFSFCIDPKEIYRRLGPATKAVIVTNLFGHPAQNRKIREVLKRNGNKTILIEDNSQSPFATEQGQYAGTIGHIGVFSLNVHKHIQCGEGGIICTDDDSLAAKLRAFINHGEMADMGIGLNLRMTEVTASIAISQLNKADMIIKSRIWQAESLTDECDGIEWLRPPEIGPGFKHVYYTWAALFDESKLKISRERFIDAMKAEGFPLVPGYVAPLYRMKAFERFPAKCPVADLMHDKRLMFFENCGYDLTPQQINQFGQTLIKIESNIKDLRKL